MSEAAGGAAGGEAAAAATAAAAEAAAAGERRVPLIGAKGVVEIRRLLSSTNPREAIPEFQRQHGLAAPNAAHALEFLQLLGLRRAEVYETVLRELRGRLLRAVDGAAGDPERLEALLERCFPFVAIDEVRPVVVAVMTRLPRVPRKFLGGLRDSPALVAKLPMPLRRQVWESSLALLQEEVRPHLDALAAAAPRRWRAAPPAAAAPHADMHVDEEGGGGAGAGGGGADGGDSVAGGGEADEAMAAAGADAGAGGAAGADDDAHGGSATSNARERDPDLQALVGVIGESPKLYEDTQRTVFARFAEGGEPAYCVLRMELLMCYHDRATKAIYDCDPCHKFAWCLDAAVAERVFRPKVVQELAAFVSAVPKEHPVIAHVAMITRHPQVLGVLLRAIDAALDQCVAHAALPREHDALRFHVSMLCTGLAAPALVAAAAAREHSRLAFPAVPSGLWQALAGLAELRVRALLGGDGAAEVDPRLGKLLADCGSEVATAAARDVVWYVLARRAAASGGDADRQAAALAHVLGEALRGAAPSRVADGRAATHAAALVDALGASRGALAEAALSGLLVPLARRLPAVHEQALRLVAARGRSAAAALAELAASGAVNPAAAARLAELRAAARASVHPAPAASSSSSAAAASSAAASASATAAATSASAAAPAAASATASGPAARTGPDGGGFSPRASPSPSAGDAGSSPLSPANSSPYSAGPSPMLVDGDADASPDSPALSSSPGR